MYHKTTADNRNKTLINNPNPSKGKKSKHKRNVVGKSCDFSKFSFLNIQEKVNKMKKNTSQKKQRNDEKMAVLKQNKSSGNYLGLIQKDNSTHSFLNMKYNGAL